VTVNVFAKYCWECPNCLNENAVAYMPEQGKPLPKCEFCGCKKTTVVCGSITEEVRPERKKRK
jgi:hypothetical protein